MVVRSSADQAIAVALHSFGQSPCIFYNLLLVSFETGLQRFMETNRLGRYDVHERTALNAWECLRINFFRIFLFAKHQAAARAPQGLMGGGGDKIGMLDRTGMEARHDEPCDMGNVREEIS